MQGRALTALLVLVLGQQPRGCSASRSAACLPVGAGLMGRLVCSTREFFGGRSTGGGGGPGAPWQTEQRLGCQLEGTPGPSDVLEYWFGGDWRKNFQTKWFTRAGSPQQAAIDRDVAEQFSRLLAADEAGVLVQGAWGSPWDATPRSLAAQIILLDQFSRHIYRSSQEPGAGEDAAEKIERNGRKALDLSLALVRSCEIEQLTFAGE
jgi:hypothetical protein